MTIDERRNPKKRGRPKKVPEWEGIFKPLNMLMNYYEYEEITPENVDDIIKQYTVNPTIKQRALSKHISSEFSRLERKPEMTKKDDERRNFLISVLAMMRGKYNTDLNRKADESYVEEPDSTMEHISMTGAPPKSVGPKMAPLSEDEGKAFGRTKYKDEYIFKKYFDGLYQTIDDDIPYKDRDEKIMKDMLEERNLLKYCKDDIIIRETIDEGLKHIKKPPKTKRRLFSMRKLISLKEKYLADGNTEKEWNALWR